MNRLAARVSLAAILSVALGCAVFGFTACEEDSSDPSYVLEFTDNESYSEAVLPVKALDVAKDDFNTLGITKVTVKLTIHEDGTFTILAKDIGQNKRSDEKLWFRKYTIEGIYTTADNADNTGTAGNAAAAGNAGTAGTAGATGDEDNTEDAEFIYELTEATSVTCYKEVGAYYEPEWGTNSTTTSKDDATLLNVFTACTATVKNGEVTYSRA